MTLTVPDFDTYAVTSKPVALAIDDTVLNVTWDDGHISQLPTFKGSEFEHASEFSVFVEALHTHGMGLITGLDVDETMLEAVVERIGPILA